MDAKCTHSAIRVATKNLTSVTWCDTCQHYYASTSPTHWYGVYFQDGEQKTIIAKFRTPLQARWYMDVMSEENPEDVFYFDFYGILEETRDDMSGDSQLHKRLLLRSETD